MVRGDIFEKVEVEKKLVRGKGLVGVGEEKSVSSTEKTQCKGPEAGKSL